VLVHQVLDQLEILAALDGHLQKLGFEQLVQSQQCGIARQLVAYQAVSRIRTAVLELNLSEAAVGQVSISPSIADVRLPRTSEVTPVAVLEPRHLILEVDRIAIEERPLAPRLSGTPPPGYWLRDCRIEPDRVLVRGPSRRIAGLDTLRVGPIDLRNFRSRATGRFPVEHSDPRITVEPPVVEVTVGVERMASQEVSGVSVRALVNQGQRGRVEPDRVGVRLNGPPDRLEQLSRAQLGVVLDARGFDLGDHEVAARADTVQGVSVIPMRESFRVVIEAGTKDSTEAGAAEIQ